MSSLESQTWMSTIDVEQHIVPVVSCVLNQLVARNDRLPLHPNNATIFHALKAPSIGIQSYLERIQKYAYCSKECFILALIYIDSIIQRNPNFVISSLNVHRLFITSVMVAAKFFDDTYCNNAYYAKVGGVSCQEMNALEIEFLFMLNFSLHVTSDVFERYKSELVTHVLSADRSCMCGGAAAAAAPLPVVEPTPAARKPLTNTEFAAKKAEAKRHLEGVVAEQAAAVAAHQQAVYAGYAPAAEHPVR